MSAPRVELVARQFGWPVEHVRDLLAFLVDGEPMTRDLAESLDSAKEVVNAYSALADFAGLFKRLVTFDHEHEDRVAALLAEG